MDYNQLLAYAEREEAREAERTRTTVADDAMSEDSALPKTQWSRFFSGSSDEINGRIIDALRLTIRDAIIRSSDEQQGKKQKRGEREGGPSGE